MDIAKSPSGTEDEKNKLRSILAGDHQKPIRLTFELLKKITHNFSYKRAIGSGTFGTVYKGVLSEQEFVAVKDIHEEYSNAEDEKNKYDSEFQILLQASGDKGHENIVRYLGFCCETNKTLENGSSKDEHRRLFCFEYISEGSLDKHVTDELRGLEWEIRYDIITQICNGLHYLHEKKIIHLDLKPGNILLDVKDGKYIPKITDFGLSRPAEGLTAVAKPRGTPGYWAPEYTEGSTPTKACDIYALGATIMKIVTGSLEPHVHEFFSKKGVVHVQDNVLRRWRHRWKEIPPDKTPTQEQYHQIITCINIAEQCTNKAPDKRPDIESIMELLKTECKENTNKMITCLNEYEMLSIDPLDKEVVRPAQAQAKARWIKLKNKTPHPIAFKIEPQWEDHYASPKLGIVNPGQEVTVTIELTEKKYDPNINKITVKSMRAPDGLAADNMPESMFNAEAVDQVVVNYIYKVPDEPPQGDTDDSGDCVLHTLASFAPCDTTNPKFLWEESDRAIDHARGAMGSLLDKLAKLVTLGYGLAPSIKEEIETFSGDLKHMYKELPKRERLKYAKDWVDEIRELSYTIEDMVDSFLVQVKRDSSGSGFEELTSMGLQIWKNGLMSHDKILHVITDISKRVVGVKEKKKKYSFEEDNSEEDKAAIQESRDEPKECQYVEDLVGIDKKIDDVKALLHVASHEENKKLRVVSITGMGGLGKTTLAVAVYDKLSDYSPKAIVSVGEKPDVPEILRNILNDCLEYKVPKSSEGTPKEKYLNSLDITKLRTALRDFLKDKSYLVLIDDIWETETWNSIFSAFPRNKHGSSVIITSRNKVVDGINIRSIEKIAYEIQALDGDESKRLFNDRIFGVGNGPNTARRKEISDKILKICNGLPLAINSVASLIATDHLDSTWESVWRSMKNMPGDGFETTKKILDLSYKHLPDHLKTCMLYFSMYREDREIDKNELLMKWVAEGLVSKNGDGETFAVDVAEGYFKRLITMCMIQPGKIDYNREVLSCRVHDIVLGLMRTRSRNVNFSHVIDCSESVHDKIRRVSVEIKKEEPATKIRRGKRKREEKEKEEEEDKRVINKIKGELFSAARSFKFYRGSLLPQFLRFKLVQVLHLEHKEFSGPLDLSGIRMLLLLRYLKVECYVLSECELKLPDKIGQLRHLETLDIVGGVLKRYPSDIVSLPWLSYLRYSGTVGIVLPDGVGSLTSLRTLAGVCVCGSSVRNIRDLGKLTKLRKLQISSNTLISGEGGDFFGDKVSNTAMTALHRSIEELSAHLEVFILGEDSVIILEAPSSWKKTPFPKGSRIRELDLERCNFESCPEWVGQLTNLYKLTIRVTRVNDVLITVSGLPSLAYFRLLTGTEGKKERVVIPGGQGAFQGLKHLIFSCPMASLTIEAGALPNLEKLGMMFRYNMSPEFLPDGIQHLPATTLKEICLSVDSVDESKDTDEWEEDFYVYFDSKEYKQASLNHEIKVRPLLKEAFEEHHPDAHIDILFE